MAEIGLAASFIQVASTGFSVAKALYKYADSATSSGKRVATIINQVKVTSTVIDELQNVFNSATDSNLASANAMETANECLESCRSVFEDIEATVVKTKGKRGKLLFPFKEPDLLIYQKNLESLKSNLQLLMHILVHARTLANAEDKATIEAQRTEIRKLIEVRDEAMKQYSLLADTTRDDPGYPAESGKLEPGTQAAKSGPHSATTATVSGSCDRSIATCNANPSELYVTLKSSPVSLLPFRNQDTSASYATKTQERNNGVSLHHARDATVARLTDHIGSLKQYICHIEQLQKELYQPHRRQGSTDTSELWVDARGLWTSVRCSGDALHEYRPPHQPTTKGPQHPSAPFESLLHLVPYASEQSVIPEDLDLGLGEDLDVQDLEPGDMLDAFDFETTCYDDTRHSPELATSGATEMTYRQEPAPRGPLPKSVTYESKQLNLIVKADSVVKSKNEPYRPSTSGAIASSPRSPIASEGDTSKLSLRNRFHDESTYDDEPKSNDDSTPTCTDDYASVEYSLEKDRRRFSEDGAQMETKENDGEKLVSLAERQISDETLYCRFPDCDETFHQEDVLLRHEKDHISGTDQTASRSPSVACTNASAKDVMMNTATSQHDAQSLYEASMPRGVNYTRTGRISKAKKGVKDAYVCTCGKVSNS